MTLHEVDYTPYKVVIDSITGKALLQQTQLVLTKVEICGSITDTLETIYQTITVLFIHVYDKFKERQTLGNDGQDPFSFLTQDNILYKGKSKVVDGKFKFEFIVPIGY